MAKDNQPNIQKTKAELREARLKAALKANMGRRKAQSRARAADTNENNAADKADEESS